MLTKKTKKLRKFLDELCAFLEKHPQFRKVTSKKSKQAVQTEIRPIIISFLEKYFREGGYLDYVAKANNGFYWKGQEGGHTAWRKQIDAALQPVYSGGPILDEKGNAIAVAVAKLSISHVLKNYGVVPENTNFGVKVSAEKNLLNSNGIEYAAPNKDTISKQVMAQNATDATLYLTCWMNGE